MKGRNIVSLLVIAAVAFVGSIFTAKDASAVPAFSRQTGHACTTCHFNGFPTLNSFGRAFKAGGFTDIGSQGKIEDEGLSIPDTLNASLITKFRYQKSTTKGSSGKSGTDKGELQFPDEAALLIGGRAAENVGFLLEFNAGTPDGASFASFKAPFVLLKGDTNVGIVLFMTDGLGVAYGFEPFNTGALRSQRPWEARKAISAQQYIGLDGAAEGFALYAETEMFFVNASLWGPAHGAVDTGLELSHYIRAGITPNVGGWDLGLGVQYWGGETRVGDADATPSAAYVTKATAIDAQALGDLGGMPLGVYISWATAPKKDSGSSKSNLFNSGTAEDKSATAIAIDLGVVPNKFNVGAAYRLGNTNASTKRTDNALMLGVKYFVAQNIRLHAEYESYSGDANDSTGKKESMLTLMLFSGF